MNTINSSTFIEQCFTFATKNLEHAKEAIKSENIDSTNITIKTNNTAIITLKNNYQNEAQTLGKTLEHISSILKKKYVENESNIDLDKYGLTKIEKEIYETMATQLQTYKQEDRVKFSKDFETFVNSYITEVIKKTPSVAPRKIITKLDLDIDLYKKGLQLRADQDSGDSRSEEFHQGGLLRYRFDERINRLTEGRDQLPHFERELSNEEETQYENFLHTFCEKSNIDIEKLSEKQKNSIRQSFLDYPQTREDTIRFSGELFAISRWGVKDYREATIPPDRLNKVTLLTKEVRARDLEDILKIGELFCNPPNFPLINVISLKAERLLKHEILMHLMLDRGVRDEDFKLLGEAINKKIIEQNPTLLSDVETQRKNVEDDVIQELKRIEFSSVDNLEKYCREKLGLGKSKGELDQVLQGLNREKFVANLSETQDKSSLHKILAMRMADFAARKIMKDSVNTLMQKDYMKEIADLPNLVPTVPINERRVFTVNGGAASGKSTAVRQVLGEGEKIEGIPERSHIVTITRDSLMTSLLDPDSLSNEDKDYFAAFAFDETILIANDVERTRKEREETTGLGPHLFYDQVPPSVERYAVGLDSGGMDGVVVNMPVEISVLLAQLRGEKEKRYAGRRCVLMTHQMQVESLLKVTGYLRTEQDKGRNLSKVHSKIVTKVDKDLDPYPTINFDFNTKTMDVNSAGYFYDFLRKSSINLEAQTLGDLYSTLLDSEYAGLFMKYASQFDNVSLKVLHEDFTEEVIKYAKENFSQLEQSLKEGELSASVQRSRQNQFKCLSNAREFLAMATKARDEGKMKLSQEFLVKAQAQIKTYLKDYGDKDDVTGRAGKQMAQNIAQSLNDVMK